MYNNFFGFADKPFNVTPDPRLFYVNESYEEAYSSLLYGIRERKGFLLLTGEVGTGKTTILQRVMDEVEPSVRFVFFYNTHLTFTELLTFVCQELGLTVPNGGQLAMIGALNTFLLEQLGKGLTVVLFVDEAQNLEDEVFENLRLLSNLETRREKLLQIVLAGQPELEKKLNRLQLRQLKQRVFSHSRLKPLREGEVAAFIAYRLKAVGHGGEGLFPAAAVRKIARYTSGIPRLINIMCDNALLLAYAKGERNISVKCVEEVARDLGLESQVRVEEATLSVVQPLATIWAGRAGARSTLVPTRSEQSTGHICPDVPVERIAVPALEPEIASTRPVTAVTPELLEVLTRALTDAMGPMAGIVIRDYLKERPATPAGMMSFERLIHLVSSEIPDRGLRQRFQETMSAVASGTNGNASLN